MLLFSEHGLSMEPVSLALCLGAELPTPTISRSHTSCRRIMKMRFQLLVGACPGFWTCMGRRAAPSCFGLYFPEIWLLFSILTCQLQRFLSRTPYIFARLLASCSRVPLFCAHPEPCCSGGYNAQLTALGLGVTDPPCCECSQKATSLMCDRLLWIVLCQSSLSSTAVF